ncbi:unnamed protein product [Protopolystoma xenopodis]|uniref:Uncharacterized protein n=1 Tax=Protopolystoma xenopodis TaxID=117903 RepID=A0A448XSC3_9PLAT|nr:unnamed protein product [Protopolystoma xenopodis]
MSDSYDYLFKFLIIGNTGTGKTCLLRRFLDNTFREETLHTIGVEFGTKIVCVAGKSLKLQIWDTAGRLEITLIKLRGAAGALVVYDIACRETFNHVADWIASARELARPELVIILVGNKVDLGSDAREVSKFAQCIMFTILHYSMLYFIFSL